MPFAQLVIGPPGAGKTTYCHAMFQMMTALNRKVAIVNLDPANDSLPYPCAVDVRDLVDVTQVMDELHLGPNGALMYAMEYIEKNLDWLQEKLSVLKEHYLLFDTPGQVELYTHQDCIKNIASKLQSLDLRLTAVHLVDSHHCTDPAKFVAVLLVSLSAMMQLELPHVNVLSKCDLILSYGKPAFNLDFYTDVLNLKMLLRHLDQSTPFAKRFTKLNAAIAEVVEDFGLVSFSTLNISDKESVLKIIRLVDKSNGYVFGGLEYGNESIFDVAASSDWEFERGATDGEQYLHDEWEQELERDLASTEPTQH